MIRAFIVGFIFSYSFSCDIGYSEIEGECFFDGDLLFLKQLIQESQTGKNPPPLQLLPLELGTQTWENGRLVDLCCSTSTNTECRMPYELAGKIPLSLENLTHLRHLSLESNAMLGIIPKGIKYLQSLESLSLSSNNFSGTVPRELGELKKLRKLALNSNRFSGLLPKEIAQMKSLEWIYW